MRLPRADDVAGKTNLRRSGTERIGIEGEHHPRIAKARQRRCRAAKRQNCAAANRVVLDRFVTVPFRLRQRFRQRRDLRDQSRRGDAACEQRKSCALFRARLSEPRLQRRLERRPGLDAAVAIRRFRAVGIVERQNRRFGKDIGRAEACRMPWIAIDLDRPALQGRHDDAAAIAVERQRGGKAQRQTRRLARGDVYVGHDLLGRPAAGGKCQTRAADEEF